MSKSYLSLLTSSCFRLFLTVLIVGALSTVTFSQDKDGDGVLDAVDLDDDNDGILDVDEQSCTVSTGTEGNQTSTANAQTADGTLATSLGDGTYQLSYTDVNRAFGTGSIVADSDGIHTLLNDNDAGGMFGTSVTVNSDPGTLLGLTTWGAADPSNGIAASLRDNDAQNITLNWSPAVTGVIRDPDGQLDLADGMTITSGTTIRQIDDEFNGGATWYVEFDTKGETSFTLNTSHQHILRNTTTTTTARFNNESFTMTAELCNDLDTDGDGIADSCDKDSDGDGCPDAIESGFTGFDVVSTLVDNNDITTTDSTFSSSAVDAFGIPLAVSDGVGGVTYTLSENSITAGDCEEICNDGVDNDFDLLVDTDDLIDCPDKDGDGVADEFDLDDDNDGILDLDECDPSFTLSDVGQFVGDGGYTYSEYQANGSFRDMINYSFDNPGTGMIGFQTTPKAGFGEVLQPVARQDGSAFDNEVIEQFTPLANQVTSISFPDPGGEGGVTGWNINSGFLYIPDNITTDFCITMQQEGISTSHLYMSTLDAGTYDAENSVFDNGKINVVSTDYNNLKLVSDIGIGGACPEPTFDGQVCQGNGGAAGNPETICIDQSQAGKFIAFTYVTIDNGVSGSGTMNLSHPTYSFADLTRFPQFCDTDGDGIGDECDLDSDGDGCPDAIEGGGNFGFGDLVDSGLDGGNTGMDYTGTSGPIIKNFGTAVDPNTGIPIIVGTGQSIGASQDSTDATACIEVCCDGIDNDGDGLIDGADLTDCPDKDGDLIADECDLDDDNDGIPDEVENLGDCLAMCSVTPGPNAGRYKRFAWSGVNNAGLDADGCTVASNSGCYDNFPDNVGDNALTNLMSAPHPDFPAIMGWPVNDQDNNIDDTPSIVDAVFWDVEEFQTDKYASHSYLSIPPAPCLNTKEEFVMFRASVIGFQHTVVWGADSWDENSAVELGSVAIDDFAGGRNIPIDPTNPGWVGTASQTGVISIPLNTTDIAQGFLYAASLDDSQAGRIEWEVSSDGGASWGNVPDEWFYASKEDASEAVANVEVWTCDAGNCTSNLNNTDTRTNLVAMGAVASNCFELDTDGDGVPNQCDLDSDGDGCSDAVESGVVPLSQNTTYLTTFPSNAADVNMDGVNDAFEASDYQMDYQSFALSDAISTCDDKDGDGVPDLVDLDDDNDGIPDKVEQNCEKTGMWTEISPGVWESPMTTSGIKTRITLGDYAQFWDNVAPANTTVNSTETNYTSDFTPIMGADAINLRSGDGSGTATSAPLTIEFLTYDDQPIEVDNPVVHFDEVGGAASGFVSSSSFELQNGLTQIKLSGNDNLAVTSTTVDHDKVGQTSAGTNAERGSGSVQINGSHSSVTYLVTQLNNMGVPTNSNVSRDAFFLLFEGCAKIDTDNDGITDDCDKDSDNDGCSDAWESGIAGLTAADIGADTSLVSAVNSFGIPVNADTDDDGVVDYTLMMSSSLPSFRTFGDCKELCCDGIDNTGDGLVDIGDTMTCPDKDGDGVPDKCDLDDDNDGILDVTECPLTPTALIDWSSLSAGQIATLNEGGTITYDTGLPAANGAGNVMVDISTSASKNGMGADTINMASTGPDLLGATLLNNQREVGAENGVRFDFAFSEPVAFTITSEGHDFFADTENIVVEADANLSGSLNTTQIGQSVVGNNSCRVHFISTMVAGTMNGTFWTATSDAFVSELSLEYFRAGSDGPTGKEPFSIAIKGQVDTDNDGIADCCDLDSDDDGCPDAAEAGITGITNMSGVMNDTLTGGVNSFGIPVVADTNNDGTVDYALANDASSTTPNFQDPAFQDPVACGCTAPDKDGDGICDMNDLDDDNDGILDTDECDIEGILDGTLSDNTWSYRAWDEGTAVSSAESNAEYNITNSGWTLSGGIYTRNDAPDSIGTIQNGMQIDPEVNSAGNAKETVEMRGFLFGTAGTMDTIRFVDTGNTEWKAYAVTETDGTVIDFVPEFFNTADSSIIFTYPANGTVEVYVWISDRAFYFTPILTKPDGSTQQPISTMDLLAMCDVDGDGITNDCDLDSDGDGCPDAVEAGHVAQTGIMFPDSVLSGPFGENGLDNSLTSAADTNSMTPTLLYTLAQTGDSIDFKSVTISLACCEEVTISNDTTICAMETITVMDLSMMPMMGTFTLSANSTGASVDANTGVYMSGTNMGTVAVMDTVFFTQTQFGCQDTMIITVNPVISIDAVVETPPASCTSADGMITITASGGIAPLMYSIDGGTTFTASPSFTGLSDGIYQVVVQDAGGICQSTFNTTTAVISPPAPMLESQMSTDVTDCGADDGTITINASGGTQPILFSINGSPFADLTLTDSTEQFTGLAPGKYMITMMNSGGTCTVPLADSIEIKAPSAPSIDGVMVTNITQCDLMDGMIVIDAIAGKDATGADVATQYSIDGGMSFQPSNTFPTLGSGDYSIVVRTGALMSCTVAGLDTILTAPCVPDTLIFVIPKDSMQVLKVDTTMLPGTVTSITYCPGFEPDPTVGTAGMIDQATACIPYTAGPEAKVDTFCIVICDDLGNKDTTIRIIQIPPTPDTVRITTMINMMETLCADVSEVEDVASITMCPPGPSLGTTTAFDTNTGCTSYTAGSTPGEDNFKVVICGTNGLKDTTYFIPTILGKPALELTKRDSAVLGVDMIPQVGEQIIYTITATNTGSVDLTNVTAPDPLLNKTLTFGNIAVGNSFTITEIYVLTQNDIDNGKVTNQATATATVPMGVVPLMAVPSDDPDTPAEGDETCTFLPGTPDMEVTKTDTLLPGSNGIVEAGDSIRYDITVTNTGVVTLTDVTITDPLLGANVTTIPSLAVGMDATITEYYVLTQNDIDNGKVTNQAFGGYTAPSGPPATGIPSDDPSTPADDDETCTFLPGTPEMTLIKTDQYIDSNMDGVADVGDMILYTITATNVGTVTLTDVTVEDAKIGLNELISSFGPDSVIMFTQTYAITQDDIDNGKVLNRALADGPEIPPTPSCDPEKMDCQETCTNLPGNPDLTLTKRDQYVDSNNDMVASIGDTIYYTIVATNTGTVTLTNVEVTDDVIGASETVGTLAPGAVYTFTTPYAITQNDIDNGQVLNQAISSQETPPNSPPLPPKKSDDPDKTGDEDITCSPLPGTPAMELIKEDQYEDSNMDNVVNIGDSIEYTLTVTNTGTVTLDSIVVSDPVIGANQFIDTLRVMQNFTFKVKYAITQNDVDNGKVLNRAIADTPKLPPTPSCDPEKAECQETCTNLPGTPDMDIIKEDVFIDNGNGIDDVGDSISYTITVTNTGTVTLTNVEIVDPLIGSTEMIPLLAVGEIYVFTEKYGITQNDIDNGVVLNQAFGTGDVPPNSPPLTEKKSDDPKKMGVEDQNCTVLQGQPMLEIIKDDQYVDSNGDGAASVGDTIIYTFTVTNTGTVTLTNVDVTDPVLGTTENIVSLTVGQIYLFTEKYAITQNDIDNGQVVNQTFGNGESPPNSPPLPPTPSCDPEKDDCQETCTPLPGTPDMEIIKDDLYVDSDGDGVASVGDMIIYTFTVTNTGTVTLTNVDVTDPVLGTTENIASLAVGQIYLFTENYAITQNDIDNGQVVNQTFGNGETPPNSPPLPPTPSCDPDKADCQETCTPLPGTPDMEIIKDDQYVDSNGDGVASIGDMIVYTFTVTNTGTVTLSNVVVTDPVLGTMENIDSLTVNEVYVFTEQYAITQNDIDNGQVVNRSFGNAETPPNSPPLPPTPSCDPDKADCQETCSPLPGTPDMEIIKDDLYVDSDGNGVASVGDSIIYTFTVTNTGTVTLTNVDVTDPVLGTTENIASLAVGQIYIFTEKYAITQNDIDNGQVVNQTFGNGETPPNSPPLPPTPSCDPEKTDCQETCTPLPGTPDMEIIKDDQYVDANGDGVASIGDTIIYSFTVTNTGTVTLSNVDVTDPVLGTTENIDSLTVNEIYIFTEKYAITQNDIDNGQVVNQTFGNGETPPNSPPLPPTPSCDPDKADCQETCTPLPGTPDMEIIKDDLYVDSDGDGVASVGDTIVYTFTVTNTGTVTLTNVDVTDPVLGTTENIASLAVGQIYIFTEKYAVTQNDIDNGQVVNQTFGNGETPPNSPPLPPTPSCDPDKADCQETCTPLPGTPDMEIIKDDQYVDSDGDGVASIGDTIIYMFTVTNTGTVTLTNVDVTDPVLGTTENIASLAVGQIYIFTEKYAITQNDIDNGQVVNQTFGNGETPPNSPPLPPTPSCDPDKADCQETCTPLPGTPDMEIIKDDLYVDSNGDGVASIGDMITYTFTVTNTGTVTLTNVVVTDPVLGSTENIPFLEVGQIYIFTEQYAITQNDIDNGQVVNRSFGNGETPPNSPPLPPTPSCDPDKADCQETCSPLPGTPDMEIIKDDLYVDSDGDGVASVGDSIIYTFTVTNTGTVTLTNVDVTDPVLGTTENIASLAVGQIYIFTEKYAITQNDIDNGQVVNQTFGNGETPPNSPPLPPTPSCDPDKADCQETCTPLPGTPDMEIIKDDLFVDVDGDGEASIGDMITYTFTVTNTGTVTLTNVVVMDPVLGSMENIPFLEVGQIYIFTENYALTQNDIDNGQVVNRSFGNGETPPNSPPLPPTPSCDPDKADCQETCTPLPRRPDMEIIKDDLYVDSDGDGVASIGDTIVYTFTVTNTGTVTLTNVDVTDPVLGTTENIPTLAVGQIYIFTEKYAVTQNDIDNGQVVNQTFGTGETPPGSPPLPPTPSCDPDKADCQETCSPLPGTPDMEIIKDDLYVDSDGDGVASIGDTIVYTFTVTNTGTVTLTNVEVTDPVLGTMESIASLAVGQIYIFTEKYAITQNDIDNGQVVNRSFGNAETPPNSPPLPPTPSCDPDKVDCQETCSPLPGTPDMEIIKDDQYVDSNGDGVASIGDMIIYTFTVTNTGTVTLTNVDVTDPVLGTMENIPTLAVGQIYVFTEEYAITQNDIDNGQVVNRSFGNAETPPNSPPLPPTPSCDPDKADCQETCSPLPGTPDMEIIKDDLYVDSNGDGVASIGDTIVYTFTVTNTGTVTLTNVDVTDPVLGTTESIASLAVGQIYIFTEKYAITQNDIDNGQVVNQTFGNAETPPNSPPLPPTPSCDPDKADCQETCTPLPGTPDMEIIKDDLYVDSNGDGAASIGDTIVYTFTVTNTGNCNTDECRCNRSRTWYHGEYRITCCRSDLCVYREVCDYTERYR